MNVNVHPAGKGLACPWYNFGDGEVEYCCLAQYHRQNEIWRDWIMLNPEVDNDCQSGGQW